MTPPSSLKATVRFILGTKRAGGYFREALISGRERSSRATAWKAEKAVALSVRRQPRSTVERGR